MKRTVGAIVSLSLAGCAEDFYSNGPYIESTAPDRVVITWETATPQKTELEWGHDEQYGKRVGSREPSNLHRVELRGLNPATSHHYRVVASEGDVDDHTFTTAPSNSTSLRFAVYGDSQDYPAVHAEVAEGILSERPEFVLHVGDAVHDGRDRQYWHDEFFAPAKALLATVPVYSAMGNHEENSQWFYYYHSYSGSKSYYAFSHGPAFVVTLDTNKSFGPESEQYAWLVDTLGSSQARQATWVFVTYHHSGYTNRWEGCSFSGDLSVRNLLMPLLSKFRVDLVFNGHMHGYERGALDGVHYIVSGGGGGALDEYCRSWPHIAVSERRHHYVTVDLAGPSLTLLAHDPSGTVFDELTIEK